MKKKKNDFDVENEELLNDNLEPMERDAEACIASVSQSYALTAEDCFELFN